MCCTPCCDRTPPCAKTESLTISTVGFFASSQAIWPPGLYRRILARTLLSMESSASMFSPAASADSLKPPGVTYLQMAFLLLPQHIGREAIAEHTKQDADELAICHLSGPLLRTLPTRGQASSGAG